MAKKKINPKYIDANLVKDALLGWETEPTDEEIEYAIDNIPTADVVEVVRCKDCKRCYEKRTKRNNQLMRFCMRMDGNEYQVNANDFCSYGERRTE